jgi:RecB family endonuclease NucS
LTHGTYHNIAKMPQTKAEASELRLLARFYELLEKHQSKVRGRFNEFHKQEYHDQVMEVVEQDFGIHLPNIFNFSYVYKFI